MFSYCSSLKALHDISNWKVENLKYMNNIFCECSELIFLPNISKWNIQNLNNMKDMFYDVLWLL